MKNLVTRFIKDESGATAIEYGLIAALISIAVVGTLPLVGSQLVKTFDAIKNALVTANGG
jgi:pilus assembly protein Flp/PilA